jgi:hypothetical protein
MNEDIPMISCRSCGNEIAKPFLDLGNMPLPNSNRKEKYPLQVYFCDCCFLVQIKDQVAPENIFNNEYTYFSSYTNEVLENSKQLYERTIRRFQLDSSSRIIEIASNDGYLLRFFKNGGFGNILGIEPTLSTARRAIDTGIPTEICFFDIEAAKKISEQEKADLVIANNVLAHVPDINSFASGIEYILKDSGTAILEFQYVGDLISNKLFDLIYHEHFSYFSLNSVNCLLRRNNLEIFSVEKTDSQGGSLRIYCSKNKETHRGDRSFEHHMDIEKFLGLDNQKTYDDFAEDIMSIKEHALKILCDLKKQNKSIAAYGASAKGSIFLNYLGIDSSTIDFIADKNENKHGSTLAGTDIPIFDPKELYIRKPDHVLLLSWNLKKEIEELYKDIDFFVLASL